jgi:CrcB protein
MRNNIIMKILLIGIGGFIGSTGRYLIYSYFPGNSGNFPLSTWFVNFIGSLLIGLFYALPDSKLDPDIRLFLTLGFCGGFTTFSAFALENLKLLQTGSYLQFGWYTISSILFCVLAVFLGFQIAKNIYSI